jgi:hypothetical protein
MTLVKLAGSAGKPARVFSMKPTTISLVIAAALTLVVAIGAAYRLDAREPRKPYPKATPPPPPSQVFTPARESAPTAEQIERDAAEHNARLALEIESSLYARDPRRRETAFTFLLPELLQFEPQLAVDMVARQEPGEARDALRDEVARQWITRNRDPAVSWMKSFENETERRASGQVAVQTLASVAPAQAIYVADQLGVGRDDGYLEHMVQLWAEGDLEDAERWLAGQPDDARTAPLRARIEQVRERNRPRPD